MSSVPLECKPTCSCPEPHIPVRKERLQLHCSHFVPDGDSALRVYKWPPHDPTLARVKDFRDKSGYTGHQAGRLRACWGKLSQQLTHCYCVSSGILWFASTADDVAAAWAVTHEAVVQMDSLVNHQPLLSLQQGQGPHL